MRPFRRSSTFPPRISCCITIVKQEDVCDSYGYSNVIWGQNWILSAVKLAAPCIIVKKASHIQKEKCLLSGQMLLWQPRWLGNSQPTLELTQQMQSRTEWDRNFHPRWGSQYQSSCSSWFSSPLSSWGNSTVATVESRQVTTWAEPWEGPKETRWVKMIGREKRKSKNFEITYSTFPPL